MSRRAAAQFNAKPRRTLFWTSWEWTTSRSTADRRCDLRVPGVYEGGEMRSRGLEDGSASWGPQHPATVPTSGMRCCSRMTAGLWPPWGCQRLGLVRIRRRDISYSRKINCTVRASSKITCEMLLVVQAGHRDAYRPGAQRFQSVGRHERRRLEIENDISAADIPEVSQRSIVECLQSGTRLSRWRLSLSPLLTTKDG